MEPGLAQFLQKLQHLRMVEHCDEVGMEQVLMEKVSSWGEEWVLTFSYLPMVTACLSHTFCCLPVTLRYPRVTLHRLITQPPANATALHAQVERIRNAR